MVQYIIHIREVAKLEVLGLNTELTAGSAPQPFSVVGYDRDGHEFDTLDGLQVEWLLGSRRNIAEFQKQRNDGPSTHIIPTGAGTGAAIAFLSDQFYKDLKPAMMQFSVKAPLDFGPSNLVLLKQGKAPIQVYVYDEIIISTKIRSHAAWHSLSHHRIMHECIIYISCYFNFTPGI